MPNLRARRLAIAACAGLAFVLGTAAAQPVAAPPPPQFAGAEAAPATPPADARQDRIEALEAQLRQATADNEQLQFQLNQAQREITRLNGVVGELTAANGAITEGVAAEQRAREQAAAQPAAPQPAAQTPQQRATGVLGTMPASDATPAAPAADPVEAFRSAQQLLLNNHIAEAQAAFVQFLHDFPRDDQAPDAQFWLSYTYLARNSFPEARDGFIAFLRRYPNHNRAAEAQVRLGMALIGLGDTANGCAAFSDLPARSARAVRDLAAREAQAAHCPA